MWLSSVCRRAGVDRSWLAFQRRSVHSAWQTLATGKGALSVENDPNLGPSTNGLSDDPARSDGLASELEKAENLRKVLLLVRAFKQYGHLVADTDPLQLDSALRHHRLGTRWIENPAYHSIQLRAVAESSEPQTAIAGFTEKHLSQEFYIGPELSIGPTATLENIIKHLQQLFCGHTAVQYQHIADRSAAIWLRRKFEETMDVALPRASAVEVFKLISNAESFEKYLGNRFSGAIRFSLEGAESLVPGLVHLLRQASDEGIDFVHMGMAHRGRLNILAHVLEKPLDMVLSQFQPYLPDTPGDYPNNADDVRYHLGTESTLQMPNARELKIKLSSNPSHLGLVGSVVMGEARATCDVLGDKKKVLCLVLHGDASMFQGSVRETVGLDTIEDYTVGGAIHVIVNNQIGFTTSPKEADSCHHCSDIAASSGFPVFHVNGDDPEEVVRVMKLAVAYRQRYGGGVVVNLVCYRRRGHNEQDTPETTAPHMYQAIKTHPTVRTIYGESLKARKMVTDREIMEIEQSYVTHLRDVHAEADGSAVEWQMPSNTDAVYAESFASFNLTPDYLRKLGEIIFKPPENFAIHEKVLAILHERLDAVRSGSGINWAAAEALAFATFLSNGLNVRLSGQDSERGTFDQRHAVIHEQADQENSFRTYLPLRYVRKHFGPEFEDGERKGVFAACNSPLSEQGVLGFEYGYSTQSCPRSLVVWEAQYGDFANVAQPIIDLFIASGEHKWLQKTNLVLLLPHGYEGQGPDHSSARIERFLQLISEDEDTFVPQEASAERLEAINMLVTQCTTPAQYFHALIEHMATRRCKPHIMFTPKSILHHRPCRSTLDDLAFKKFQNVLLFPEDGVTRVREGKKVQRLVLCSGNVVWSLRRVMKGRRGEGIVVASIEQLAPFPFDEISRILRETDADEIAWMQEEPKNMGAWSYVRPRIETCLKEICQRKTLRYIGRPPSASPATASFALHSMEKAELVAEAIP